MILRKLNKSNYIKIKVYRFIILKNTLDKILENVMIDIINYLMKTHKLLSTHHYEERSERSVKDIMMILIENIYKV